MAGIASFVSLVILIGIDDMAICCLEGPDQMVFRSSYDPQAEGPWTNV